MRKKALQAAGLLSVVVIAAAACSDDNGSSGGAEGPIKIGVLTSQSGPASAAFAGTEGAVKARLEAYKADGGKCSNKQIDVVMADDQSSPQGALVGTQKLVQQDNVHSMLEVTPYFFGAATFATTAAKDTPVLGAAIDAAPQWLEDGNNLFAAMMTVPDTSKTYTSMGDYWKSLGIKKIASVAYDNKASADSMESVMRSAEDAGIERVYVNDTIPLGSTDVGSTVLGIKNSGAQALYLPINPDTSLAIVAGLRQAGVNLESIVSASGYGGDLLASPPAVQAAQGVTFLSWSEPAEMNTPATQKMSNALKKYADSATGIPTMSQQFAWNTTDLFLHGLEISGCNASPAEYRSTLREDKTWDDGGMFAHPVDFSTTASDTECLYMVDLKGDSFVPQPKNSPLCGTTVAPQSS
ncbi:ABC transporter substrate-binding protein [Gordonia rhizosphera]|uniref:Putative ABC transporter substrate-binding protein n=1 Tax=Gordonia rhizosphera NBRC 16068 TaxID=1108045 RepID=K6WT78_9ACTN|nr:ABC transporter substrate-binding protein [Gordonia rhizosphera]GAB89759.1 putative ABC transporter substrate-binding protein [Gordonia rhizosphera NBRC 16068]